MAKVGVIQYSTTPASNSDVNSINIAENAPFANMNNMGRQIMADVVQRFGSSVSVASASTVALGDQEEQYVTISGTTGISSFGTPGVANKFGYWVKFDGALTLTHNATSLILPGGADITTAAGDVGYFQHEGTGNWRCLHWQPATGVGAAGGTSATSGYVLTANGSGSAPTWQAIPGGGYAAKTAGYTVIASDEGGIINFTTAGATLDLTASATLGAGFAVTVMNTASTGDVTIDPASTETLDGLTTRLLRPGDRVTIVTNGSNWFTVQGVYSYDSGAQTITAGGALTLAHGLGVSPDLNFECSLTNVTDEHNWTTGMVCPCPVNGYQNSGSNCWTFQPDTTNLNMRFGSSAPSIYNRTTGTAANITAGNWTFRVIARKRYG